MREPNSKDADKWLRLVHAEGLGPVTVARLLARFGKVDRILGLSVAELAKVDQVGPRRAERIAATREKFDAAAEIELAERLGVWLLTIEDERYPPLLKRIHDPPPVLYVKGAIVQGESICVAIVGSRRCSMYGREQSSRLAHVLAAAGFTVCSGMARGIDTAAHQGALAAGGRTIAVQGCGLVNVFPRENKKLFESISRSGACISELPLGYEPLPENFPPRNRIIAGLSLGTIVIDAGARSGALITAGAALDYDREVMAVPGRIDSPVCRGSNRLIKQGARLVESAEDVMDALGYFGSRVKEHVMASEDDVARATEMPLFDVSRLKLEPQERAVYLSLGVEPLHIEQIIAETGLPAGAVNAWLVSLRLKGLIRQLPGSVFAKKSGA